MICLQFEVNFSMATRLYVLLLIDLPKFNMVLIMA